MSVLFFILGLQIMPFLCVFAQHNLRCNETNGMDHPWCLPTKYDSKKPPFLTSLPHKMNLHFTFSITEVSEVNDLEQTLKIPMYFTVSWNDSRLHINENHKSWAGNSSGPVGENTEEVETIKSLWKPSLEIYGLEKFSTNEVLGEMAGLRITKFKEVKYDIKTAITISCQMDFSEYPFDNHICNFQVGSYFFDKDAISCTSEYIAPESREGQKIGGNGKKRERRLQHSLQFQNLSEEKATIQLRSGIYAACGFEIHLDRKHEPLIWQVYLPCCLFVIVSWISFIIDPLVIPGRMSLLVILLLVSNNVFNQVKSTSPSEGSRKLNDVESYIVTCIFMIFSAIMEYAILLSIYTLRPTTVESTTTENTENGQARVYHFTEAPFGYDLKGRLYVLIRKPRILDVVSIITFSSSFILFNINYWISRIWF